MILFIATSSSFLPSSAALLKVSSFFLTVVGSFSCADVRGESQRMLHVYTSYCDQKQKHLYLHYVQ